MSSGPTFQRRDVLIGDGSRTITCKLWSNSPLTQPTLVTIGNEVQKTNMSMEHFKTRVSLKSNDDTETTVCFSLLFQTHAHILHT